MLVVLQFLVLKCLKIESGFINYVNGANIGGFVKVAEAMLAQGAV